MTIETSRLVEATLAVIRQVQLEIRFHIETDPEDAFAPMLLGSGKGLLSVDHYAEKRAKFLLQKKLELSKDEMLVLGEENLTIKKDAKDLTNESRLVALLDMVDGTDLLERGLSNWCSAVVFFDPQGERGRKILAAFVGIDEEGVYYSTHDKEQVFLHSFHVTGGNQRDLALRCLETGPSDLSEVSLCFYGQQAGAFLSLVRHKAFLDYLEEISCSKDKPKLRIYNLAGNPMMVKMFYGNTRINMVVDTHGQFPHDMVAGAFIACKAGAVLMGLKEETVDLETSLLHPADERFKLQYVLASNRSIAAELRGYLSAEIVETRRSSL
jgi:fructose-1,6-bisphosphatase/inositol monophosphatase family enzyme